MASVHEIPHNSHASNHVNDFITVEYNTNLVIKPFIYEVIGKKDRLPCV
jgi:hypothetical protein